MGPWSDGLPRWYGGLGWSRLGRIACWVRASAGTFQIMLSDTPPVADDSGYAESLSRTAARIAPRWIAMRVAASALVVAGAYWLTGWVALRLPFPGTSISALWLPNSVLLSALLLARRRDWWVFLLLCLPAQLMLERDVDDTWIEHALIHYAVNCTTALIAAFALAAVVPRMRRVERVRTGVALVLIGGVLAPLSTSVLFALSLVIMDHSETFWLTTIARTLTNSFA